jgi:uncharacterized membrane protein YcaP (DUF421 family)
MDIVVRATVIFFAVFLVTRMVGRRELGMNEPFDLILLVVIGDLIQQGVTQSDSYISFRSKSVRTVLEGNPLVLVEDGKPITENLKSQRMVLEEVLSEARMQQVSSLDEIRWAILETSGSVSIIPKQR